MAQREVLFEGLSEKEILSFPQEHVEKLILLGEPLVLSERAVAYLKEKINEHSAARELASRLKNRTRHR